MMEFDQIVVKESPGLCRCCLSEGCYKDLGSEYSWMNETEVYADMLLECFDISISQHNEGPNGPNRLICEVCITRLRDACNFKKQVLESEKKFVDMVGRGEFRSKVLIYQTHMKAEELVEVPIEGEVEYLEDDIDFGEAEMVKDESVNEPSVSEVIATTLPAKGKRGRPRKATSLDKPDKKAKVPKLEEKAKTSKVVTKGVAASKATIKSSISATKRNRQMRRNALTILESSTAIPFKWHRQNYLCFYCHLTFKSINTLKDHMKNKHEKSSTKAAVSILRRDEKVKIDITNLQCRHCNNTFNDLYIFVEHLKTSHSKTLNEDYDFGVIPYIFANDLFQCAVCNDQFEYFIKLNQHMNDHYGSYICELCGKSFLSHQRLKCHTLSHISGYKCIYCPETFESKTLRNNHTIKQHDIRQTHKCFYCPETFDNYNQRKIHHNTAHNIPIHEYSCPVCDRKFQIMSKMRIHLKEVHERVKNFACSMCDLKFFSKTHVRKHMVKHIGDRIHQCEICSKSYPRKQSLRDHMRIHNEKRYSCEVCNAAFVQSRGLKMHMKVHSSESQSI